MEGWHMSDFEDEEGFAEWVATRPPKDEYERRAAYIIQHGLPAKLKVVWDGLLQIELLPLDGWTWLATEQAVDQFMQDGWRPHISLSKYTADMATYERVVQRYDDVELNIGIHRISSGAAAVLAWEGIGADPACGLCTRMGSLDTSGLTTTSDSM
jgi:hypothetical protein